MSLIDRINMKRPLPSLSLLAALAAVAIAGANCKKGPVGPSGPTLAGLTLTPAAVAAAGSAQGTVTLSGPAPSSGLDVGLTSSSAAAATPSTVTIAGGANSATFTITTTAVSAATSAVITASLAGSPNVTAALQIGSAPTVTLTDFTLNSAAVIGSLSVQGTVTLSGPAPGGGVAVGLSSSAGAAVTPATVTVPAGSNSVSATITTTLVPANTSVVITASLAGASRMATLQVNAPPICTKSPGIEPFPFFVYAGFQDIRNHFPPTGFIGDFADLHLELNDNSGPPVGTTNIRIDYTPRGPLNFAGIFFMCGDFGNTAGAGFNLSGAQRVRFFARANTPNGRAEFKSGGLGRGTTTAPFADSFDSTSTNPVIVNLDTTWREFVIDLSGRNTSFVNGGFLVVTNTTQNPTGISIFLANIVWE